MPKKLRNIWLLVLFVIGCSAQWEPQPVEQQQGVQVMPSTYAGNNTFPTSVTIPSDGDDKPAVSVNVALEGALDRTQWLYQHSAANTKFLMTKNNNSSGDPVQLELFEYDTIGTTFTKSTQVVLDIPACEVGDILLMKLTVGGVILAAQDLISYRVRLISDFGGAAVESDFSGSRGMIATGESTDQAVPFASMGQGTVSDAGPARAVLEIRLRTVAGGSSAAIYSGVYFEVERLRA